MCVSLELAFLQSPVGVFLRLILIMSTNEQANQLQSDHLLIWARTFLPGAPHYPTLDSLPPTVPPVILSHISNPFFQKRESTLLSTLQAHSNLQLYLQDFLGKSFKRRRFAPTSLNLYSLVLYICVHCENSSFFINRILELNTDTQLCLMKVIEQLDRMMGDIVEIGQVLDKVGELEEENEGLRRTLEEMQGEGRGLMERIADLQDANKELEQECMRYRKERCEVMRELNIGEFADYLQLAREWHTQRKDLLKMIKRLQQGNRQLQRDKGEYKQKIIQDSQLIKNLHQQLVRFKGMYKSMRLSTSCASMDLPDGIQNHGRLSLNHLTPYLNEAQNMPACRTARSVYDDETVASEEYRKIKDEWKDVKEKYGYLKERHQEQGHQLKECKHMMRKYRDRSRILQAQLDELKGLQDVLRQAVRHEETVF